MKYTFNSLTIAALAISAALLFSSPSQARGIAPLSKTTGYIYCGVYEDIAGDLIVYGYYQLNEHYDIANYNIYDVDGFYPGLTPLQICEHMAVDMCKRIHQRDLYGFGYIGPVQFPFVIDVFANINGRHSNAVKFKSICN